ncbi:hypothetical protein BGZ54_004409 [Gamsiella multidivaricata]|nr:hypothetical protein BGZ54_004409 [Gamsiella multidivaricata]
MSSSNVAGHQSSSQQVDPAVEKLVRETKSLKAKIDLLEAENKALKKSLYELSYIYSAYIGKAQHNGQQNRSSNSNNNSNSAATDDDTDNIVGTSSYRHDDDAHSDMALAVGQLLSSMSVTQQKQGAEAGTPNTASGSDPSSRDLDAKLKSAADLIKVEEEGVRRLNMGSIVSRQDGASKSDGRQFFLKNDLKGHQGAVYAVQYSPNGKFLATGSFDKTVRIWDGTTNQNELYVLKGHGLNISDLAWGHDSSLLLSAAYDKTCKLWDVESGNLLDSFEGEGFVQCVRFHPHGYLKTWDMRMGRVLQSILNEPTKSPISHIAVSKQRGSIEETNIADTEEQESRWLAVNSYDNVIRVYDRGFEPPTTVPRLIHSLKGYRNKHWPIKSAFFHGKEYIAGAATRRSGKVRGADGDEPQSILSDKDIPLESSLILASGSMDPYVYLFDVGAGDGQYDLLQKLSGHTDRVYDVDFHPIDHVLASGSADFSVKVWGRASKRKK